MATMMMETVVRNHWKTKSWLTMRAPRTIYAGAKGAGRLVGRAFSSSLRGLRLVPPHRDPPATSLLLNSGKPQSIGTDMCANHRRDIDHQNIARHRLTGFLHHRIQKFFRTRFRAGVQDGQPFKLTTL